MSRITWRVRLAACMIRHGWGWHNAHLALLGNWDDPYYDEDPPYDARAVLREESSHG